MEQIQAAPGYWVSIRRLILPVFAVAIFALAILSIELANPPWTPRASMFPLAFCWVALGFAILDLLTPWVPRLKAHLSPSAVMDLALDENLPEDLILREERGAAGWLGLLIGGIIFVGFHTGILVFLVAYLRLKAKASWITTTIYTGIIWLMMFVVLQSVLNMPWPEPLIPWLHFN
jgi:uncharacterized membrane protein YedE/YeeE